MNSFFNLPKYCNKCKKIIKKLDRHPSHLLHDLNLCYKTGKICDNCYYQYLGKSLHKIGINVLDKNGNCRNFSDVLKQFQDIWSEQINE